MSTPEEDEFIMAAKNGDLERLKQMRDVYVECKGPNRVIFAGATPLLYACALGHLPVVKYLVDERGAKIDTCDVKDGMPLHKACYNGHLDIVRYLVGEKGADTNVFDRDGDTPLHKACMAGHVGVVEYLVDERKIQFDVANNKTGKTPLQLAYEKERDVVVDYLDKMILSANERSHEIPSPNQAEEADVGAAPDAMQEGNAQPPKFQIPREIAFVEADDREHRLGSGSTEVQNPLKALEKIPKTISQIEEENNYRSAAGRGDVGQLEQLLGVDVDCADPFGNTPLHKACWNGHLSAVQHLVDVRNCTVEIQNKNGHTPLQWACRNNHLSVVQYLVVESGAQEDVEKGLKIARDHGNMDIVGFLERHQQIAFSAITLDRELVAGAVAVEGAPTDSKTSDQDTGAHAVDGPYSSEKTKVIPTSVTVENPNLPERILSAYVVPENEANAISSLPVAIPVTNDEAKPSDIQTIPSPLLASNEKKRYIPPSALHPNEEPGATPSFASDLVSAVADLHEKLYETQATLDKNLNLLSQQRSNGGDITNLQVLAGHSDVLQTLVSKELLSRSERNEIDGIAKSEHHSFYVMFMQRLQCSIRACETLSSDMVSCSSDSLRQTIRNILQKTETQDINRSGTSGTNSRWLGGLSFTGLLGNAARVAGEFNLFPLSDVVGSVVHFLLTIRDERTRRIGVSRVAKFATILRTKSDSVGLARTVERTARIVVRHRMSSKKVIDKEISKWKSRMMWVLGDQVETASLMQACCMADIGLARIMECGNDTSLWKSLHSQEDADGIEVHKALAAVILGEESGRIDSILASRTSKAPPRGFSVSSAQEEICFSPAAAQSSPAVFIPTIPIYSPNSFVSNPSVGTEGESPIATGNSNSRGSGNDGPTPAELKEKYDTMFEAMSNKVAFIERQTKNMSNKTNDGPRGTMEVNGGGQVLAFADYREKYKDRLEDAEIGIEQLKQMFNAMAMENAELRERLEKIESDVL